jgi:hypothetical protein
LIERSSGQFFIRLIPREIALGYYVPHCHLYHRPPRSDGTARALRAAATARNVVARFLTRARGLSTRFNCKYLDRLRDVLQLLWTEVPKTESELSVDLIINEP